MLVVRYQGCDVPFDTCVAACTPTTFLQRYSTIAMDATRTHSPSLQERRRHIPPPPRVHRKGDRAREGHRVRREPRGVDVSQLVGTLPRSLDGPRMAPELLARKVCTQPKQPARRQLAAEPLVKVRASYISQQLDQGVSHAPLLQVNLGEGASGYHFLFSCVFSTPNS